jgi:tRNA(His) 5'-end guanylyltransferase
MIKFPMIMETILRIVLVFVFSDHGNFLFKKSLIKAFPNPKIKEYMVEISRVIKKLRKLFSFVKNKKINSVVPNDTQSKIINPLRFMICFLDSKLVFNKGIENYFLPKGIFSFPNGIKKAFRVRKA